MRRIPRQRFQGGGIPGAGESEIVSYRLVVQPQVDADLIEAEAWYELRESGLGREFLRAARDTIYRLLLNPFIFRIRLRLEEKEAHVNEL